MSGERASSRWLIAVLIVGLLAGVLRWGAVETGLMSDDFMQQGMIAGVYPGEGYVPFDLYAFLRDDAELLEQHVAVGTAPWWSVLEGDPDAATGTIRFTVLRPLASALASLDRVVSSEATPRAVWSWHVHSWLWFVAAIAAGGLVFRRVFGLGFATLALILLACDASFVVPIGWLAARCALVCATFGFLAIWAHLNWRTEVDGRARRRWLALEVVCMALAVAAGEYGLVAAAYVLAYELCASVPGDWRTRARALVPATIPVLAYLVVHRALDYGTFGEVYADVFGAPLRWLSWAAIRVPMLATSAYWSPPAGTGELVARIGEGWLPGLPDDPQNVDYERGHVWLCGLLALVTIPIAWIARAGLSVDERRGLRWLIVGGLLGLLPLSAAPAQDRLLGITQLGACAAIAGTIVAGFRLLLVRPPVDHARWPVRLALVPVGAILLYAHTLGDIRWGRVVIGELQGFARASASVFADTSLELGDREVVVLNAPNLTTGVHGGLVLDAIGRPQPSSWRCLAMGKFALVATRPADDVLELSTVQGAWLATPTEQNFRRVDQPLRAGDVRERRGLRAEIVADTEGRPTRVRFGFPHSLDDPRYVFVIVTPTGLQPWSVPAVGGRGIVPRPGMPTVLD